MNSARCLSSRARVWLQPHGDAFLERLVHCTRGKRMVALPCAVTVVLTVFSVPIRIGFPTARTAFDAGLVRARHDPGAFRFGVYSGDASSADAR